MPNAHSSKPLFNQGNLSRILKISVYPILRRRFTVGRLMQTPLKYIFSESLII